MKSFWVVILMLFKTVNSDSARAESPLKVSYSRSEVGLVSDMCFSAYKNNYGAKQYIAKELPYARLISSKDDADIFLCMPGTLPLRSGMKKLQKGRLTVHLSYFYSTNDHSKTRCTSLLAVPPPPPVKPLFQSVSGAQMAKAFESGRVNCVYIVEEEFVEILRREAPRVKYTTERVEEVQLEHWAAESAAKLFGE